MWVFFMPGRETQIMDKEKTRIIAITGGLGSGKSTVGKMISDRGYLVIDSDRIAHELTEPGSPVLDRLVIEFGEDILVQDGPSSGTLDRKKLAGIVFSDEEKRRILESILHPEIIREYRRRTFESGERWVFILIPLLFEAGREDKVDAIWLCYTPKEMRLQRGMERDGTAREHILARMAAQVPDEEKRSRCDVVINTSVTLEETEVEVAKALDDLESTN